MPSTATRNVLLYSTRVGLYRVGGMWWEQVVVRKVLWGGPVTVAELYIGPNYNIKIDKNKFK